jgi:hypothetical protein
MRTCQAPMADMHHLFERLPMRAARRPALAALAA